MEAGPFLVCGIEFPGISISCGIELPGISIPRFHGYG